jgi:hypothetical protein
LASLKSLTGFSIIFFHPSFHLICHGAAHPSLLLILRIAFPNFSTVWGIGLLSFLGSLLTILSKVFSFVGSYTSSRHYATSLIGLHARMDA